MAGRGNGRGGDLRGTQEFMCSNHFQQKAHPSTFYSATLSPWFLSQSHKMVVEAPAIKPVFWEAEGGR